MHLSYKFISVNQSSTSFEHFNYSSSEGIYPIRIYVD